MDLISVIIPVYKTEKYLKSCVDSVLNQTYEKLEVILVDDGSPDAGGAMCDTYAELDPRVRVIHKENGGLSDARNAGLDIATGEYIAFADSDDSLEPEMIERLYGAASGNGADITVCNFKKFSDNPLEKIHCAYILVEDAVMTGREAADILVSIPGETYEVMWNKLYRRSLFENERFEKGRLFEDAFIIHRLYALCSTVATLAYTGYNYRVSNESITRSSWNPKKLDAITALWFRTRFYYQIGEQEFGNKAARKYMSYINEYFPRLLNGKFPDKKEKYAEQLKQFRTLYPVIIRKDRKYIKEKLCFALFYIKPELYYKLFSSRT